MASNGTDSVAWYGLEMMIWRGLWVSRSVKAIIVFDLTTHAQAVPSSNYTPQYHMSSIQSMPSLFCPEVSAIDAKTAHSFFSRDNALAIIRSA